MNICFVTAHGNYGLSYSREQTLQEICWINKILSQNVTFYGRIDENTSVIVGKYEPIRTFENLFRSILVRLIEILITEVFVKKISSIDLL